MQSNDEIPTPVCLEEFTIYVAIELSGKSWVIGVKPPGSGKVGLHTLKTSDTRGLFALIERHREDALKKTGATVRARCSAVILLIDPSLRRHWFARCRFPKQCRQETDQFRPPVVRKTFRSVRVEQLPLSELPSSSHRSSLRPSCRIGGNCR